MSSADGMWEEIGVGCCALGGALLALGSLMFFNCRLLALGNVRDGAA